MKNNLKIQSYSLPDIKYGHLKPHEDSYQIWGNIFCLADGITRDPLCPIDFGDLTMTELLKNYPNPSPAKMAADCFCKSVTGSLKDRTTDIDLIKQSIVTANKKIQELNRKYNPNPDYLVNDFYACVALAGVINDNKLSWASIGDCQVMILDKIGKIKFVSTNGLENFLNYIGSHKDRWSDPERRKEIRSQYRNNPNEIIDGKTVSYGALTGEEVAETFIMTGAEELEIGDLAVFYTDGFAESLKQPSFNNVLVLGSEEDLLNLDQKMAQNNYEKYGKERTIIAVKFTT